MRISNYILAIPTHFSRLFCPHGDDRLQQPTDCTPILLEHLRSRSSVWDYLEKKEEQMCLKSKASLVGEIFSNLRSCDQKGALSIGKALV